MKIGADQLALDAREVSVGREGVFHFVGARFERCQQVAVAAFEILQYVGEVARRRLPHPARGPGRRYGRPASCRSG